jgi:hypothetical protein
MPDRTSRFAAKWDGRAMGKMLLGLHILVDKNDV